MAKLKSLLPLTLFSVAISLTLLLIPGLATSANAQSRVTFRPPGAGRPDNTVGGATRSANANLCAQDTATNVAIGKATLPSVMPLLPETRYGNTVSAHPTFFVYIPETSAKEMFFSVEDENQNSHYQAILPITRKGGIVQISLPKDAPALEVGKTYKWSVAVMCGNTLRPDSPLVTGWVQHLELNASLATQLATMPLLEQAVVYGKEGFWYDTLTTLATLVQSQPSNAALISDWEHLLTSVGLEAVATKPLLPQ